MKSVRIFISSPGDVAEEREKAKQVIAALQQLYSNEAQIVPVLWENLPLGADASFQQGIDLVLNGHHAIDIAVFILWSRLGTPLGPPPKPDGTPYRSGTEREFDLILAARRQSNGVRPHILVYTRRDDESWNATLDAKKPDQVLKDLIEQREMVRGFIQESFHDSQGHNLRAYHSYDEPVTFAQRLHTHLKQLLDALLSSSRTATWSEAPYRSLEVFDIRHAPIFCGRDEETCDLLQRLRDQQRSGAAFACIVGASGSGKSSLARAGVAATLMQRSFDGGVKEWRAAVFLASLASGDLFSALSRTLAEPLPELRAGVGGIERFAKRLEDNQEAATDLLEAAFKTASAKLGGALRLLLVLDQMEELWTDRSITPDQREKFLQAIEALALSGHLSVLATLRSDFYPQAQLSQAFLRMKGGRGHFDLTPPGPAALQDIIVQSAHRTGLSFERDERTGLTLDQRILEDAARDPSALPLLQYALAELHERRDDPQHQLTFAAYEAMGGVEGALGKRAAQTFNGLPHEAQAALVDLLPLLVSVDTVGEQNAVRRRAPLADLTSIPARRQLTERLIQARFLTTDELGGTPIATLAHESLLRRWDRIATWINTNRDLLRMRARIEQYQAMWEESVRDASRLLPAGLPLEEGRRLMEAATQVLDEKTSSYVQASTSHHEKILKQARGRRNAVLAVLSVLTLVAVASGLVTLRQLGTARDARRLTVEAMNQLVDNVVPLTAGAASEPELKQRSELIGILERAVAAFPNSERDADVERLDAFALSLRAAHDLYLANPLGNQELQAHPEVKAATDALGRELTKGAGKSWDRVNELSRKSQAAFLAASEELRSATEKSRRALPLFEKLLPLFPQDSKMRFRYGSTARIYAAWLSSDEAEVLKHHDLAVRAFTDVAVLDHTKEADALATTAEAHQDVGRFYINCGDAAKAEPFMKLAEQMMDKLAASQQGSPKWLGVVADWHSTNSSQATLDHRYEEAKAHQENAVALRRRILSLDPKAPAKLALGKSLHLLAMIQNAFLQQHDRAIALCREALPLLEDVLGRQSAQKEALESMVATMDQLSAASIQKDDSRTAEWAAEQAVAHQRRLLATDPLNLKLLSQFHEAVVVLHRRYGQTQKQGRQLEATQLLREQLELAEKGMWLTQNTTIHPMLEPEENPVLWRHKSAKAVSLLRPASNSNAAVQQGVEQRWDAYVAAVKAADQQLRTAMNGHIPSAAFLAMAGAAYDLAEVIISTTAREHAEQKQNQQALARVLLEVSRNILTRSAAAGPLAETDRRRMESTIALLKQVPAPAYNRPLLDQLLDNTVQQLFPGLGGSR